MVNIAYLTWLEDLCGPIIRTQVIDLLKEIKKNSRDKNLFLISFQPLWDIFWGRKKYFANIRKDLSKDGIKLLIIPAIATPFPHWFNLKWYLIPLIFLQSFPVLLFISILKRIQIFHCRSYPITLSAITVKRFKRVKVIFDPRSPFPEENIIAGRWTNNSLTYKMWKYLEKKYLIESDITIAISRTYIKHFKKISANFRFVEIPNNVNITEFAVNENFRRTFRLKIGVDGDEIVFVYSGSLRGHWNNSRTYAKFLIKVRDLDIKHRFLFITKHVTNLKRVFDQYGIQPDEYFAISAELKDVPLYLSSADFGLNFMSNPDIRISIKTVEYLAMGLPIIINSNLLGGKELINQYDVGLVVDLNDFNLNKLKHFIQKKDQRLSLKCRRLACEKFSTVNVAKRYADIYERYS